MDYLLEAVASMMLGFHFIGVAGLLLVFLGFYSIGKIPPLVLGLRFSPYRMEPPGLVRIPTGMEYVYIYIGTTMLPLFSTRSNRSIF